MQLCEYEPPAAEASAESRTDAAVIYVVHFKSAVAAERGRIKHKMCLAVNIEGGANLFANSPRRVYKHIVAGQPQLLHLAVIPEGTVVQIGEKRAVRCEKIAHGGVVAGGVHI